MKDEEEDTGTRRQGDTGLSRATTILSPRLPSLRLLAGLDVAV